jgi:hypothetical protein
MRNNLTGGKVIIAFWAVVTIVVGTLFVRTVLFIHDVLSPLAIVR